MRVFWKILGVLIVGLAAFLTGLAVLAGLVALWLCGILGAGCLLVAAFAGVVFAFTGSPHDLGIAVGFLGYAAVPFVIAFALAWWHGEWKDRRRAGAWNG